MLSGKRKADSARPNGDRPTGSWQGRVTSASARGDWGRPADSAIKARDKGGTGGVGLIKRLSPDKSVTGGEWSG